MGAVHLILAALLFVLTFCQTSATEDGEKAYCGEPPQVLFAYRVASAKNYSEGERIRYSCKKGYQHVGGSSYKFCHMGLWVGHNIICEQITPLAVILDPRALVDYKRQCCIYGWHSRSANQSCASLVISMCEPCKSAFLECCAYQDGTKYDLQHMHCAHPPKVAYAYVSAPDKFYEHGEKVHYACLKGYQQTSNTAYKVCENGTWAGQDIVCEKILLPENPDVHPDVLKDYIQQCCLKGLRAETESESCEEMFVDMCEPCKTPFLKCCFDKTITIDDPSLYTGIEEN
ncbi:complement factor H [Lingula anatina]|uniref:Complement factor H n=1 Tax=Lingula anatina TaxID=7574 RepID=A0A1S3IRV8_LINAN|nr:complement factor H [Lingula anatina]|eukprot:XP_013400808.1 complement factor H [Lingula anatina]